METYFKNLEEKYRAWSNDELINAVNARQPLPSLVPTQKMQFNTPNVVQEKG